MRKPQFNVLLIVANIAFVIAYVLLVIAPAQSFRLDLQDIYSSKLINPPLLFDQRGEPTTFSTILFLTFLAYHLWVFIFPILSIMLVVLNWPNSKKLLFVLLILILLNASLYHVAEQPVGALIEVMLD